MVTQLIGGSLTNMQVVFGPWWYEMEPDELRSRLKKHKLMLEGAIAKNEEEFKEFEKLVQLTHQVLVRRSRDDHRIQHNKELRGRNPPGIPIPRLEDLGVITDEMLDDLDRIFVSEYAHPMSHDFGHNAPDYRNKELAYIQKVSKYLDRYAQREVRGLDPSDYTERHHRLLRASVIFELYFTPFTDISCLPFPTKSMVEALWVALEPYDYAFVEVCKFLITSTIVRRTAPQACSLRGALFLVRETWSGLAPQACSLRGAPFLVRETRSGLAPQACSLRGASFLVRGTRSGLAPHGRRARGARLRTDI
jgi:hypothetical protein